MRRVRLDPAGRSVGVVERGDRRGDRPVRENAAVSREDVEHWIARYLEAWRSGDGAAAAALFTEDCAFRSHPFREPEDAGEYTRREFADEEYVEPHFGEPVVEGDRAAVEYWAAMNEDA